MIFLWLIKRCPHSSSIDIKVNGGAGFAAAGWMYSNGPLILNPSLPLSYIGSFKILIKYGEFWNLTAG